MLDAADFQRWFTDAVTALPARAATPPTFAVYRNTWLQGLLDSLGGNYPIVAMLLGRELFEAVALEFARLHLADTPVLALYGAEFPEFLRLHEVGREIPYLRDVAQLERLWTESFFATDAPMLEPEHYEALRPAQLLGLQAHLHPATRVLRFETPAVTIWQAHRADKDFEQLEPEWKAENGLIARRNAVVSVSLIDEAALHLLAAIGSGKTIGSNLAATAEAFPDADLSKALTTIISSGALATHSVEDDRIW